MPYTLILACSSFIEHSAIFYITHLQHKYIHYENSQMFMYFNLSAVGVVYLLYVCAMHAGLLAGNRWVIVCTNVTIFTIWPEATSFRYDCRWNYKQKFTHTYHMKQSMYACMYVGINNSIYSIKDPAFYVHTNICVQCVT